MNMLNNMTIDELEKVLSKLKINLDEIEEERMFVLSQTGLHVPGATVKRYEAEVYDLREKIEETEKALKTKKAEKL